MSAETITAAGSGAPNSPYITTLSDGSGGGAGRGGDGNTPGSPLVVVQQPRAAAPPRPAPRPTQGNTDNSLRNGYAAISHSVSGETAAIGLGFLAAGPAGAILAGAALPVLVAASMWRARRREHDTNTNNASADTGSGGSTSSRDRSGPGSGSGRGNGSGDRHRSPNGPGSGSGGSGGGGRHKTPKHPGSGHGTGLGGGGKDRKPKVKDPVADKLSKTGKQIADKLKNRDKNRGGKAPKDKNGKDHTGTKGSKGPKNPKASKQRKDYSGDYPDDRRWRGRGHKDKPSKTKNNRIKDSGDTTATTAPDGLDPKGPKGEDPKEKRIDLVRAKRERDLRRQATKAGKRAEKTAARDGTIGDPIEVKLERIRYENHRIDLELHHADQMLALAASTEQRRNTPVTYPVAALQPAGTGTPGTAIARQLDPRGSTAYRILAAMAEHLAHGLHHDADADMADHVVELAGVPALCRNLATAVREAAAALQKTAPLHPSVIKHLNNSAIAALTAAHMADTIIVVFVQAHRDDIYRVLEPRIGEERWNIRNAAGTLDGAKLRAAILSSGQPRLALPAGSTPTSTSNSGRLVPASADTTKKLINLMKSFDRGHMVVCLSEVAGAASGVDIVADSITRLYRRMAKTWPTEHVVDDTVRATATRVQTIADELRKAVKAAQRAHQRELKLNANPRKGAHAESKWDVVNGRRG